jgi:hypothetical protein
VIDAHQGLDQRLLQNFRVVCISDVEDGFDGEEDNLHYFLKVFCAGVAALEEKLPKAHEDV